MSKVWAHRGASGYAPENTLAAFALARDQLADGVELDVQFTSDGELVVIHDELLDRTTSGHGLVRDHTLAQIKALDASMGNEQYPGQKVPTLDEVFDLLADTAMSINVEIKDSVIEYPGIAEKVLDVVDDLNWEYRTIISSFNHNTLAHIRQVGSLISTGVLFQDVLFEPWNYAHQLWATALHPHHEYASRVDNLILEAHNSLLEVNVWTVDEVEDIDAMLRLDVDGIMTNYPDRVLARIEALGLDKE